MISIIIPIFNVEQYLKQCLDSVLSQTYEDFEVLLINDGSTDSSENICKEYIQKDKRFHLITTANRGLSAARNTGIQNAKGEWIMFIDSDDYVDPEFCRVPFEAARTSNADVVIFKRIVIDKNGNKQKSIYKAKNRPEGIITFEQAIDFGENVIWNKLYKKTLFKDIVFPEGKYFEDIFITPCLLHKASIIYIMPVALYYYRKRNNSLSNQRTSKAKSDAFEAYLDKYDYLISFGYPKEKAETILDRINGIPNNLSLKRKGMLVVWKLNKPLFEFICKLLKLKLS